MALSEVLGQKIKEAMLAKDKIRLQALRSLKKELLEAQTAKGAADVLSEEVELKLVQKLCKQRKDSASIYIEQGREDLAQQELEEATVLQEFLPEALSAEELEVLVKTVIEELGAESMKDMGGVMKIVTERVAGRAEGKEVSVLVKKLLS